MRNAWQNILSSKCKEIQHILESRLDNFLAQGVNIHPPRDKIYAALDAVDPDHVKVVIVGQDPYHGEGQANGLSFSVAPGVSPPPSLRNIFRELTEDIGCELPSSGDLTPWAEQGVLLLNTILTVEHKLPGSHENWGWQAITHEVLRYCADMERPAVFMLWGRKAVDMGWNIKFDKNPNHLVIRTTHPSPLSTGSSSIDMVPFRGSRPFSSANKFLIEHDVKPVEWSLP